MKDTALYEQLLGLKTPWSVKGVDLSLTDQRVVVNLRAIRASDSRPNEATLM